MADKIRVIIIHPESKGQEVELLREFWDREAAALIGAEAMRPFNRLAGGKYAILVDEESEQKGLPYNHGATVLLGLIGGAVPIELRGPVIFSGALCHGFPTDLTMDITVMGDE